MGNKIEGKNLAQNLWGRLFSIEARSGRLEYVIITLIFNVAAGILIFNWPSSTLLGLGVMFILILVWLMATYRRFNDLGLSQNLIYLNFVPVINFLFQIYLALAPGKAGDAD